VDGGTGNIGSEAGSTGQAGAAGGGGAAGTIGGGGRAGGAGGTSSGGSAGANVVDGGTSGGAGAGGTGAGGATPAIISIDFVGGRASSDGDGGTAVVPAAMMAATEVAGVRPAARWNAANDAMGKLTSLVDGMGESTAASITWNAPSDGATTGEFTNSFTDMPGDTRMMNGFLNPPASSAPAVITVSGLPTTITSRGYDVYVYSFGNIVGTGSRTYNYAIGTTTLSVVQVGPSAGTFTGYVEATNGGNGNYVVFRGLGDTSFTLTATPGTGTLSRAPVNGIQIVPAGGP
jgi:hypothetical protein